MMNTKQNYFQRESLVIMKNLGNSYRSLYKNKKAKVKKNQKVIKKILLKDQDLISKFKIKMMKFNKLNQNMKSKAMFQKFHLNQTSA